MYDVIVIGNDLSSIVAATLISHSGKKTALLSEGDCKHVYSDYGYTFNIDPLPLTGFGPSQVCSSLLDEVGILFPEGPGLEQLNPGLQIVLTDHRIDCPSSLKELLVDMKREFPAEARDIAKLYTSILKIGEIVEEQINPRRNITRSSLANGLSFVNRLSAIIKERFFLSRKFKSITANPSIARVLEAQKAVLSNSAGPNNGTISVGAAYALSLPLKGMFHHVCGNEKLIELLRTSFSASGGQLIDNCSIMRLAVSSKVVDVDFSTPDALSSIQGRYLITTTKWEKLRLLLADNRKFKRVERRFRSVKTAYYPFTLHMGVLEKGLPEKIATYVAVVIDKNRPVMDDNLVLLEVSAKNCEARAPAGRRALSATVFLRESPLTLTNDELKEISQIIFCALERFLPFIRENLDFLNIGISIELSRKSQELVNKKYTMLSRPLLGIGGLSNRTPLRNVLLTGGMLEAELGFQGEIMTGINAANSVIAKEKNNA
ncbi:MAG TPA: hypothetical protein VLZ07_02410 [Syntrophales bacterium]|nr:hypothetical protein [Syntrophales bacterium]